ncbi:nitrite reductase/ring-hydroxylating ferredoxin subunit [Actinomadura pelletieri DSM 43383]|uniref:Nitrite reductase/ring-hydroxylating ferredoxin subunit n=1 Tax=Actinomadura pelletieri DSM 43383 TaxID=1120940 RepID=A0A495QYJ3_9ACTN|nr:Rieske 2Fe-2S domain-containing protein [Actinomadura pelletieri]RKS79137.1 nitrite reductase/ring-hydroxylating ferredoxin subunit [Actinomadura pelletieri DSM 43383]
MERKVNIFRRMSRPQGSTRLADATESLEHMRGLDRVIRVMSTTVRRTLRPGPVKDALHGVPLGHPAHPPLSDMPIGFWVSAAVLDLLPGGRRASQTLVAAGLASAVPTVLTGIADWSALHREQQRVGLFHAAGMATASSLYTASLVARGQGRDAAGRAFGFAGLTVLFAGAYLGGHLAFRQAAGASHADQISHLVPLGWHDLCAVEELPDGWPVHRRLGYISLFVLRKGGDIHILADRCSHLAGPLHQGRIVTDDNADTCVICPWHGSTFRVDDGSVVHGPATARQPAFESRVTDEGTVQVRPY